MSQIDLYIVIRPITLKFELYGATLQKTQPLFLCFPLINIQIFREYLVDLFEEPGALSRPDSSLNGTSSIVVSSPLCHPRFKLLESATSIRTLAKLYFFDDQSHKNALADTSTGYFLVSSCTY